MAERRREIVAHAKTPDDIKRKKIALRWINVIATPASMAAGWGILHALGFTFDI